VKHENTLTSFSNQRPVQIDLTRNMAFSRHLNTDETHKRRFR